MAEKARVYGYVNGVPCYTAEEFRYTKRGFGEITSDEQLMKYAEKVTSGWYDAGWHRGFLGFYLSDYCLSEPYRSLTKKEFTRLKELQAEAMQKEREADEARCWKKIDTVYWADNSVEEIWEDKDGARKTVTVVGAHGDVC